MPLRALLL